MSTTQILAVIFEIVIFPLLGALTTFAIKWLKAKTDSINTSTDNAYIQKYVTMLDKTITSAVIAVNQTYVDELKKQGKFDVDAQKIAFQRVYDTAVTSLTEEAKYYLEEIIGDLDNYITNRIEESVKSVKEGYLF